METKLTSKEVFQTYAPSFNFEYNAEQLVKLALERGFLTKIEGEDDLYLVNESY